MLTHVILPDLSILSPPLVLLIRDVYPINYPDLLAKEKQVTTQTDSSNAYQQSNVHQS